MKRILSLSLAVVFALMLLASCGSNAAPASTTPPPAAPTDAPTEPGNSEPAEPAQADSGLPFAVDERGIATEPYNYPLPLTTSDDVITYWWSTYSPQYLPTDKEYGETELPVEVYKRTGVNVEYIAVVTTSRVENFAVLLNSDDLCDIMTYATAYYPGNPLQMVEDGYFANVYDHKEWMPNYLYQSVYRDPSDTATYESVFYTDELVPVVWLMNETPPMVDAGYCVRQDWLDKIGMKADEIVTWDDMYEVFGVIKSTSETCEFPMWLSSMLEMNNYWQWCSFDNISVITTIALPPVFLLDGKVQLGCTTPGDKKLMEKFYEFYTAGFINPDWHSYFFATFQDHTYNNETFYQSMGASAITTANYLTTDPNCDWRPVQKPLVTEDQMLHVYTIRSRTATGHACFAAKNTNLELSMKWIDYRYSPEGWELYCYGPEGIVCELDENGVRRNTEWALHNPDGVEMAGLFSVYTVGAMVEPGITHYDKQLLNEDGAVPMAAVESWTSWLKERCDYSGALPIGVRLDVEQSNAVGQYRSDVITYVAETFASFLDGSNPLSMWDEYQATIKELGVPQILAIYQEAYDSYMASKG